MARKNYKKRHSTSELSIRLKWISSPESFLIFIIFSKWIILYFINNPKIKNKILNKFRTTIKAREEIWKIRNDSGGFNKVFINGKSVSGETFFQISSTLPS